MSVEQHAEAAADSRDKQFSRLKDENGTLRELLCQNAVEIRELKARVEALEGLGPLIEEMKVAAIRYGESPPKDNSERALKLAFVMTDINRILKGGAP